MNFELVVVLTVGLSAIVADTRSIGVEIGLQNNHAFLCEAMKGCLDSDPKA